MHSSAKGDASAAVEYEETHASKFSGSKGYQSQLRPVPVVKQFQLEDMLGLTGTETLAIRFTELYLYQNLFCSLVFVSAGAPSFFCPLVFVSMSVA